MSHRIVLSILAAMLGIGGLSACAQPFDNKASDKETRMENPVMAEADKAAQAAEDAASRTSAERRALPIDTASDAERAYLHPAKIEPMPWPAMQRRIAALIASIHQPEDTHPKRVEGVLGVSLARTSATHWTAEGIFDEGWEYSISVAESGTEEYAAGHDIYIYLTPPEEHVGRTGTSSGKICTWSMDELSKVILQNGYVKGAERKLSSEVWDFFDLTSNATYNRYMDTFVYRIKDESEHGAPCLSRIHISTGYKEDRQ